ncbi:hypothetical protein BDU57DRAFT_522336 [Ampelomyces quisqualis]|uniref:Uncharacterized protein n=1 Tax=Ampelomyces quisqualis TaxID=50730 RepID=A0A6A5QF85_AMPQU|nr:hypothetical protein BDU57DRAFT_522336 [Ampelomyces quisqualis]
MAMTPAPTYHTTSASRSGKDFDDANLSGAGFFSDEHMEENNVPEPEPPRATKRKRRNTMKSAISRDSVALIGANDNKGLIDTPPHKRPSKGHPLLHKSLEGWVELRCIIKDKHTTKQCHSNARMVDGKAVFFDTIDFKAHVLECHDIRNFDIMRHCAYRKLTDEEVKSIDFEFSQDDHSQIPLLVEKEPRKEQDLAQKSPAAHPDPTVLRGMLTRRKSNAARPQIRLEAMP